MRAVVYEQFGATPRVDEVRTPSVPPGAALVEVAATGLCRSDWHGWMGHDDDIRHLPNVPGHEFAGTVTAVGEGVERVVVGQRVTAPFVCGCGTCPTCRAGDPQVCPHQTQPGFTHWGSFAEYVVVHSADANVVSLPDEVGFNEAASLGCRFATSFRAVLDIGRVQPGEWVAVHGCGGVGLSAVMIAAASGARVIAIDIAAGALERARSLGAVRVVDATAVDDVPAAVAEMSQGGVHVSLDALGHSQTCRDSILCLRRRGRHVQIGLLAGDHENPPLPMGRVIGWELEVLGSHGMAASRYPEMLSMITSGMLQPARLIGEHISLDQAPAALVAMGGTSPVGVTVITPTGRPT